MSLGKTIIGYIVVFKDRLYMVFILVSIISVIVYLQMNSTLSVYLLKVHDIPPKGFGYILSLNAAMVVAFSILDHRVDKESPSHGDHDAWEISVCHRIRVIWSYFGILDDDGCHGHYHDR